MATIRRLPRRFPVGTRYVLEAVPAQDGQPQVISRLLVLPNGEEFDLTDTTPGTRRRARRATPHRRTKH